jgi:hypothetical protein
MHTYPPCAAKRGMRQEIELALSGLEGVEGEGEEFMHEVAVPQAKVRGATPINKHTRLPPLIEPTDAPSPTLALLYPTGHGTSTRCGV